MDLRDYLRVLRKGWPVILAFVVVGLAAGIGLTLATTKVYQASVQVFVATSSSNSNAANLANGNAFTQDRVQSYTAIANAPMVTDPVVKRLHLPLTGPGLAGKITADAPLNKALINLHVTDHDPRTAARLANAVAAQFDLAVERTEQTNADGDPVVKLTVVHPAKIPSLPIEPHKVLNVGLGFVLGLIIGVGVVVLRDVLDNTVKDSSEYEAAGVPAMGVVPLDKRIANEPIAFRGDPNGARAEAYRQIRTNLQFVDVDNPPRIISVTSAVPGEGKSTTAMNLAAALAEAGSRVCLIEADLRRPTLAKALGLIGDVGFTTALIGKTPVEDVLQNAGQNLAVLTSGPIPPNPSELLITEQARQLIQQVAAHVDFVVIDTPPLLPVTDGATVATLADATLLVVRTGKTTREQATRSIDALAKVGRRPVGVVLNMVTRGRGGYSYEYGYYYTAAEQPEQMGRSAARPVAEPQSSHDADADPTGASAADTGPIPDYDAARHAADDPIMDGDSGADAALGNAAADRGRQPAPGRSAMDVLLDPAPLDDTATAPPAWDPAPAPPAWVRGGGTNGGSHD